MSGQIPSKFELANIMLRLVKLVINNNTTLQHIFCILFVIQTSSRKVSEIESEKNQFYTLIQSDSDGGQEVSKTIFCVK